MKLSDRDRFYSILDSLAEYWKKDMNKVAKTNYRIDLDNYNIETIATACRILTKERKKIEGYPTPADIIDIIELNPGKTTQPFIKALPEPLPTEEDKLWGKYQSLLIGHLGRHYSKRNWVKGIYRFKKSHRRWDVASLPEWRYEWFRKHTDMPEEMLNKIKKEM